MEDYGNGEVYDGAEESAGEENVEESGYPDDPQDSVEEGAEESAEGTIGDGAEENTGDTPADGTGDGETQDPPSVDVGELVELLKGYTEDGGETEEETDAGSDISVPEVPTAVTDAATVETLAEIRGMLEGMSVSMNSIYTETAAYQTEALSYMEESKTWLSGIFFALLVVAIAVAAVVGLKIADIFFGRMRT